MGNTKNTERMPVISMRLSLPTVVGLARVAAHCGVSRSAMADAILHTALSGLTDPLPPAEQLLVREPAEAA